jgi:hypothetical protein
LNVGRTLLWNLMGQFFGFFLIEIYPGWGWNIGPRNQNINRCCVLLTILGIGAKNLMIPAPMLFHVING